MAKTCVQCGKSPTLARGLCNACYKWHREGKQRPAHLCHPRKFCQTCGQSSVEARNECNACYRYRRRHGKQRPAYRWKDACGNCGAPRQHKRYKLGRCENCYEYRRTHGTERPAHLWKRYCDCGNVATHLDVQLSMMTVDKELLKIERYDLCQDCYQLETQR